MADKVEDIELKFDGRPIRQLQGAPADLVVSAISALQRMLYIIGMAEDGKVLSERIKPSAKVKHNFVLVCKPTREGSHIQPFNIASQNGDFTASSIFARNKLIKTLEALDSGEDDKLRSAVPNARERWFIARAARGLIPPADSDIDLSIRLSEHGPASFSANRARSILERYDSEAPQSLEITDFTGTLKTINFTETVMTIKPRSEPAIKVGYPMQLEPWLKANVRQKLTIHGIPRYSQKGDITGFDEIHSIHEIIPSLEPIDEFQCGKTKIACSPPISIPILVDWTERLHCVIIEDIGVNVQEPDYADVRSSVIDDLKVLWTHYALSDENELDDSAQKVRSTLRRRMKETS